MLPLGNIKIDINKKGREFANILCSFNSLFDIEIGCIGYILLNYQNSKYIKPEAYNYTEFYVQYQLVNRDFQNPLQVIFKDEYKDQIDNLYSDLLSTKWDEIVRLSPITYLAVIIEEFKKMSGYIIDVECSSEAEKKRIDTLEDINSVGYQENLDKYFTLILNNPLDIKDRLDFSGKTVYFWNSSINYANMKMGTKDEIFVDEIVALMSAGNKVKLIDPYRYMNELDDE